MFTKARLNASRETSRQLSTIRLENYRLFIRSIASACIHMKLILTAYATVLLLLFPVLSWLHVPTHLLRTPTFVGVLGLTSASGFAILGFVLYLEKLDFPFHHTTLDRDDMRPDATDDLVDALSTRQASISEEMVFGVRSVLEKMLQRKLPLPDYTHSKHHIYRQLTYDTLTATSSLQACISAALVNFSNGPSWVADWGSDFPQYWTRPEESFPNLGHATPGSQSWFRWEETNGEFATNSSVSTLQGDCMPRLA